MLQILFWMVAGLAIGWIARTVLHERGLGEAIVAAGPPFLNRHHRWRDANQRFDAESSFGARLADRVAGFGGSWTFIALFTIGMIAWMASNQELTRPFDPYPYILLNLVLSCVAALQAPVILMSQNRQAERDRSDARHDYEVNTKAEMEITALHTKLDLLREQDWVKVLRALDEQQRVLAAMQTRLETLGSTNRET